MHGREALSASHARSDTHKNDIDITDHQILEHDRLQPLGDDTSGDDRARPQRRVQLLCTTDGGKRRGAHNRHLTSWQIGRRLRLGSVTEGDALADVLV